VTKPSRKIISLNGDDWKLGSVPLGDDPRQADPREIGAIGQWHQATVPGNVRLDLLRAGVIEDPFYGLNNRDSQWVDARNWWYLKDFPLELAPGERAHLVLHGVDYVSWVYFNGRLLVRRKRTTWTCASSVRPLCVHPGPPSASDGGSGWRGAFPRP